MLLQRVPRVAERIIAVTEATRGDVIDILAGGEVPIDVVHNGVSRFWSQNTDSRPAPRGRNILWVGNPKPHKGLDLVLGAFAILASRDPRTPPGARRLGGDRRPGRRPSVPTAHRRAGARH